LVRVLSYQGEDGSARAGAALDDSVVDLHSATDGALPTSLLGVFETPEWRSLVDDAISTATPVGTTHDLQLLAPMRRPPKLLATASNYQRHIDEGGGKKVDKTRSVPKLFLKPSSAIIGPGDELPLPSVSDTIDWEIELGIVIGATGFAISPERALDHVAGYTIVNDVSARTMAWGLEERDETHRNTGFFDWLNGKWPNGFAPIGPWITSADEVGDPQNLEFSLTLNGEVMQTGSTSEMIFTCRDLIVFASRFMTLEPGDIIATGTGAGCGVSIGRFLVPGDVMEARIEGLGTLTTPVGARLEG
jgi:2-keto-4-pentenoate hydratase/2-oxohepta-3-ene-1,7-dioic acid hydratase in catechol pathway